MIALLGLLLAFSSPTAIRADIPFLRDAIRNEGSIVQFSLLAISRSKDPTTKSFALSLIGQHGPILASLEHALDAVDGDIPTAGSIADQATQVQLDQSGQADFEGAVLTALRTATRLRAATFEAEARRGRSEYTRNLAASFLPQIDTQGMTAEVLARVSHG